jgi:hypothetical protein
VFSLETFDIGTAAKMAPATNTTQRRTTARPARATSPRFSITSIDLIRQKIFAKPQVRLARITCRDAE